MPIDPHYPKGHPLHLRSEDLTPDRIIEIRRISARKTATLWAFAGVILTIISAGVYREYELYNMSKMQKEICITDTGIKKSIDLAVEDINTRLLSVAVSCEETEDYIRSLWAEQQLQEQILQSAKK